MASTPPRSMREWRKADREGGDAGACRAVWNQFEEHLLDSGLQLWKAKPGGFAFHPPSREPRQFDGFGYDTVFSSLQRAYFPWFKTVHCPATTKDGRHVLVRVLSIGAEGKETLEILREVGSGRIASLGQNHTLPLLQEIKIGDIIFGAFPMLHPDFALPWYYTFGEVADVIFQLLEGLSFLHEKLIAHRDLFFDNVLLSFCGGAIQMDPESYEPLPFRGLFPCRYYIIDFEFAVKFEPDSDPLARVTCGLPTEGRRRGEYGRALAPELRGLEPYCPFKLDVWQIGSEFRKYFSHLGDICPALLPFIDSLVCERPDDRQTAENALGQIQAIRSSLNNEQLEQYVPIPECLLNFDEEDELLRKRVAEDRAEQTKSDTLDA